MDLASVDHLLTTTRSVRKRLDLERPVDLAWCGNAWISPSRRRRGRTGRGGAG